MKKETVTFEMEGLIDLLSDYEFDLLKAEMNKKSRNGSRDKNLEHELYCDFLDIERDIRINLKVDLSLHEEISNFSERVTDYYNLCDNLNLKKRIFELLINQKPKITSLNNVSYEKMKEFILDNVEYEYNVEKCLDDLIDNMQECGGYVATFSMGEDTEKFEITRYDNFSEDTEEYEETFDVSIL